MFAISGGTPAVTRGGGLGVGPDGPAVVSPTTPLPDLVVRGHRYHLQGVIEWTNDEEPPDEISVSWVHCMMQEYARCDTLYRQRLLCYATHCTLRGNIWCV